MDIVERLRDAVNRHYGKDPAGLLVEAAEEIEWFRQQNAELVEALTKIASWHKESLWRQYNDLNLDDAVKIAADAIAKATGGE